MEQWEIDLRAKLEAELPDACYEIGGGDLIAYTGKQGKINYEVELYRSAMEFKGLEDMIDKPSFGEYATDVAPTIEDFKTFMNELKKKQDGRI